MKHSEFKIGDEFTSACGEVKWRCTDVGSRVIVAVCLDDHPDDPSWYKGPPYAVAEYVFDEHGILDCEPITPSSGSTT